jgi:phospholipase/lecithinase/hemolysin
MRLLCLVLGLLLLAPLAVFGGSFDTVVVFGDSLSDIGNLYVATGQIQPVPTPDPEDYYQGRFSNGPVWVEYLTDENRMNCQLVDMAYGGAGTKSTLDFPAEPPGMVEQVAIYLKTYPNLHENALYVIWIGANDFILKQALDPTPSVGYVKYALDLLAKAGIQNILILNLPDMGASPGYAGTPGETNATNFSVGFNTGLASVLNTFQTDYPNINVYELDIFAFLSKVIADPDAYGFTNASTVSPNFLKPDEFDNSDGYVFWDTIHPTTEAHEAIADEALTVLPADAVAPDSDDDDDNGLCFIQTVFSAR